MKRHQDALGIMEGACNLRAIARSLVQAADEAAGEGIGAERDAAVRMIVYRLARLCQIDEISCGYDADTLNDVYCTLMTECLSRAKEGSATPVQVVESATLLGAPQRLRLPEGVQG